MNNVDGKWVSNEAFKKMNQDTAWKYAEWLKEIAEKRQKKLLGVNLNSIQSAMGACMREVERIEKIEAMKEANSSSGRIIVEFNQADYEHSSETDTDQPS